MKVIPVMNFSNFKPYTSAPRNNVQPAQNQLSFKGFYPIKSLHYFLGIKVYTEAEAIAKLKKASSGAFVRKRKGFVSVAPKDYEKMVSTAGEYIFKSGDSIDIPLYTTQSKLVSYRGGFTPYSVLYALNSKAAKITQVLEDGLEVLHLPRTLEHRKQAFECVVNVPQVEAFADEDYTLTKDYEPMTFFNLAQEMVSGAKISGFKLEQTHLPRSYNIIFK